MIFIKASEDESYRIDLPFLFVKSPVFRYSDLTPDAKMKQAACINFIYAIFSLILIVGLILYNQRFRAIQFSGKKFQPRYLIDPRFSVQHFGFLEKSAFLTLRWGFCTGISWDKESLRAQAIQVIGWYLAQSHQESVHGPFFIRVLCIPAGEDNIGSLGYLMPFVIRRDLMGFQQCALHSSFFHQSCLPVDGLDVD